MAAEQSPIRYVGTLSYSLYLCQQPFLHARVHNILTGFPLNVGCAVLAALSLHYLVERPMLRLRNRSEAPQIASLVTAG